jgi:hypothetical protein
MSTSRPRGRTAPPTRDQSIAEVGTLVANSPEARYVLFLLHAPTCQANRTRRPADCSCRPERVIRRREVAR